MRMQVILDSPFERPGSAPIGGGKKGEFRDWTMYYTVIKHDGHLRTRGKCRKHEPQASVFYISRVFPNDRSVSSHCNTRLRLLHLL